MNEGNIWLDLQNLQRKHAELQKSHDQLKKDIRCLMLALLLVCGGWVLSLAVSIWP